MNDGALQKIRKFLGLCNHNFYLHRVIETSRRLGISDIIREDINLKDASNYAIKISETEIFRCKFCLKEQSIEQELNILIKREKKL